MILVFRITKAGYRRMLCVDKSTHEKGETPKALSVAAKVRNVVSCISFLAVRVAIIA